MNKAYKTIWSESSGTYVAVSENVKAKGKRSSSSKLLSVAAAVAATFAVSGVASAQVISEDLGTNTVNFTVPNGTIAFGSGGSITGLTSLTVGGENVVTADQLSGYATTTSLDNYATKASLSNYATTASLETTVDNLGTKVASVLGAGITYNATTNAFTGNNIGGTGSTTVDGAIAVNKAAIDDNIDSIDNIELVLNNLGLDLTDKTTTGGGIKYFRTSSLKDDAEATGEDAVAIGPEAVAEGDKSFAAGLGAEVTAEGVSAIALGDGAKAGGGAPGSGGTAAVAIGRNSTASGTGSVALGDAAQAAAANATALGANAKALGGNSIAIGGAQALASGSFAAGLGAEVAAGIPNSIALGTGAGQGADAGNAGDRADLISIGTAAGQNVSGSQNIAIGAGSGSNVNGFFNVALGQNSGTGLLTGSDSVVSIGRQANYNVNATVEHAVAIGSYTQSATNSVSIGSESVASSGGIAIGYNANSGDNGVALGSQAKAVGGSVALGQNSGASKEDWDGTAYLTTQASPLSVVSVGNRNEGGGDPTLRRIVNVADGASGSDAATVNQLQRAQSNVAGLIGGDVLVNENGTFSQFTVRAQDGKDYTFDTVAEGFALFADGTIELQDPTGVTFVSETDKRITGVAAGTGNSDVVNVGQLNQALADKGVKYFHVNSNETSNQGNNGAAGSPNAMAIGPAAVAGGASSIAFGHDASTSSAQAIAIGNNVDARGEASTVIGNSGTMATHEAGVAIGKNAHSYGVNSIVIGTGARSHLVGSDEPNHNTIVIGTSAEATADNGIAIGEDAVATNTSAVALGHTANAHGEDSMAFGTRAQTTGTNSQASGTDANASGLNAQASGTGANASGLNAVATGTGALGYATDGIAMGTGAESGFSDPNGNDPARNTAGIAIGNQSKADQEHALALGVEAEARAKSSAAIGDGAKATSTAENGLAVGTGARVTAFEASAFGSGAEATAANALAVGSNTDATAQNAAAFGNGAQATAKNALALGNGAEALHAGSVALGDGSTTATAVGTSNATIDKNIYNFAGNNPQSTVSVGAPGSERTITNVAAGRLTENSTDAINGSQLYSTNQAVNALGDNLDTTGQSIAAALGGGSSYNPNTHQVTASLTVNGNTYTNVQDALGYVGQGWNVGANKQATENVAPGGSVDFSSSDGNIAIARTDTNLTFGLEDEITVNNSITIGGDTNNQTVINEGNVTTNNLTVGGETRLGDNFVVNNDNSVTYNGTEIANKDDGLSFAGNTGGNIAKKLSDTTPLTISGALAGSEASTGANLRVDSDGSKLNLVMARDLTDLDSITINNGGPIINSGGINMGGKKITNLAPGTDGTDAVNLDQLKAVEAIANLGWNVTTNADATSSQNVAPDATVDFDNQDGNIVIGQTGTNLTFDLAKNLSIGGDGVDGKIGVNGADGKDGISINPDTIVFHGIDGVDGKDGSITMTQGSPGVDGQDGITRIIYEDGDGNEHEVATLDDGLKFAGNTGDVLAKKLGETLTISGELDEDEDVTGANLRVDSAGGQLNLVMARNLTDLDSITINNSGPIINSTGINMNNNRITNLAPGVVSSTSTDAINGSQLQAMGDSLTQFFGDGINFVDGSFNWDSYFTNIFGDDSGITDLAGALEPWKLGVNDGENVQPVLPGDTVDLSSIPGVGSGGGAGTGGDGNIVVDIDHDGDNHNISLALSDNIHINQSVTVGDTAGAYVAIGDTEPGSEAGSVTFYGDPNKYANRPIASQTVGVGPGGVGSDQSENDSTRLVYEDQDEVTHTLATLSDGLSFTGNTGTQIDAPLNSIVSIAGASTNTVWGDFDAGQNIMTQTTADGQQIVIALSKNIKGLETIIVGENGNPGKDGVDGAPGIGLDGKDGTIGINGKDGSGADITVAQGAPGIDGNDGVDGLTKTRIVYEKPDGTIEEVATLNDGLYFQGDVVGADGNVARKLNQTLALSGGESDVANLAAGNPNVGIIKNAAGDGYDFLLAKDLTGLNSIQIGNNSGFTPITLGGNADGSLVLNPGGTAAKITNVAAGDISLTSTDAINGSQLQAMGDSLTQFFGEGINFEGGTFNWGDYFTNIFGPDSEINSLAGALEPWTTGANGGNAAPVLPGDNVDFSPVVPGGSGGSGGTGGGSGGVSGDGNIVVAVEHDGSDHNYTLDLADDIHVGNSVTVGDKDGAYISMGDDGGVGSPGSLNFYGEPDADGNRITASQTVVAGPGGVGTDQEATDGTRLGYTDGDGNEHVLATLGDGLSFGANDGAQHDAALNTRVDIVGADTNTDWTKFDAGQNIMTQVSTNEDGTGRVTVALSKDLEVTSLTATTVNSTTVNATTVNASTVNADSIVINNGGPIINKDGINMNDNRITNVAPGIDGTDAVNLDQLTAVNNNLQTQIDGNRYDIKRNNDRANAGIAAAMATAGLPQAYLPGKSMVAVAGGVWRGESGMAIGVSTVSENGKWILKGSANTSGRGGAGGTIGAGYQW